MSVDCSNVDIYGAFSKHLNMGKKQANTHGGEFWTHCPFCGTGKNRFHIWPYRFDSNTHYWCRVCDRSGDVIDFIEQVEGLSFLAACNALNITLDGMSVPRYKRDYSPNDDESPSDEWQAAASKFARECKDALWSETGKNALAWLRARGLSDGTMERAGIGYNPVTRWDEKDAWSVGHLADCKTVWLPRGIVIPWLIERQLWKISIRRPDPDIQLDKKRGIEHPAKYVAVKGGSSGMYGIDRLNAEKPTVVVEGEFDKLILSQIEPTAVNVVATGSTAKGRGEKWAMLIAQSPIVLIAYDADPGGEEATKEYWLKYVPQSLPWQPWSHDINDMHMEGMSVHEWLFLGIETAEAAIVPAPTMPVSKTSALFSLDDLLATRPGVKTDFRCVECGLDLADIDTSAIGEEDELPYCDYDETGRAFCSRGPGRAHMSYAQFSEIVQSMAAMLGPGCAISPIMPVGTEYRVHDDSMVKEKERREKRTPFPWWLVPGTPDWKTGVERSGLADMQERRAAALKEREVQS